MSDSSEKDPRIFSKLIDYLDKSGERINWNRLCWEDGRYYKEKQIGKKLDTDFPSTDYSTSLMNGEINFDYHLRWDSESNWLGMKFSKWARIGIKPQPHDVVLFFNNPYHEMGEEWKHIPIFQARREPYSYFGFENGKAAVRDIAENGERLSEYFEGMQQESMEQYLALIHKFQQFKDVEEVINS